MGQPEHLKVLPLYTTSHLIYSVRVRFFFLESQTGIVLTLGSQ